MTQHFVYIVHDSANAVSSEFVGGSRTDTFILFLFFLSESSRIIGLNLSMIYA